MADKAHRLTDEKLEEMEKRLSAIYSRAEKEIQKTADEYFSKFAKQDEAKRKLVEQGKLTEEEYTKWRKGKVMYGKRFTEMKEQCAKQLLNVNQTALAYVNGELPEVYAINYNALAGSVDGVGGYSFTLVDADTVRNLAVTDTSLLPYKELDPAKDIPWNMKKINAETLQGILQGESMDKIAKRIMNVQTMNKDAAIRSARTIVTGAENKGRLDSHRRAEEDGIILEEKWVATKDGRTRHSHAMLNGETKKTNETFSNGLEYPGDPSGRPEEVYNCFVGETKVASDSDVVRSYKHKYDGKIISIKTASGVQFSCTPNHPILTPDGWVAAELLNNGNNILVTFGENNVFSRVDPNVNHRFPRIDTIHKFGKKFRSKRTSCLGVDFHGDVATSNVEIVTHKRLLGDVRNSGGRNGIDKVLLEPSNKTFSCFGSLFKHFWSICKTSFGFISRKCKSLPFFKCSVSHPCEHSFGTIANRDNVLTEYSINDLPADTVIDGELLDRLSCKVFLDTIVNVDVSVLSTHVYNLQTENGYYFVNSIIPHKEEKSNGIFAIAKNCRCTMTAKVLGFKKVQVQKAMEQAEQTATEKIRSVETRQQLESELSKITGAKIDLTGTDIDLMRENMVQLISLGEEYGFRFNEIVSTGARKYLGEVTRKGRYGDIVTMQYPKTFYKSKSSLLSELRNNSERGEMPIIPGRKISVYTTTHEFAHTLSEELVSRLYGRDVDFWDEIEDVYARYRKSGETVLGKYATSNQNEFMAEAFAYAKLGNRPNEYADEVLSIIDKYFKRKKK